MYVCGFECVCCKLCVVVHVYNVYNLYIYAVILRTVSSAGRALYGNDPSLDQSTVGDGFDDRQTDEKDRMEGKEREGGTDSRGWSGMEGKGIEENGRKGKGME